MQQFRTVRCDMWRKDDWFADLAPDAKLVWIYTFTNDNTSPAGIYRIALRTIANDTGIGLERVRAIIAEFGAAGKLEYEDGIIWPITMRKHQVGELNPKDNLAKRIANDLADLPDREIVARYKQHYSQNEPPSNPLPRESEGPNDTLPVNRIHDTRYKRQETGEEKGETPPPPPTVSESATFAREQSARLGRLNAQVAPALRTPLANAILDMTGKRALADAGGAESERVLAAAHEAAVTLYQMGVKSESALLALEPEWRDDWRGCNGGTAKQLLEFVSERQGGKQPSKRSNGNGRNDASRGFGLASLTTDADRAYHASIDDAAIAELQAEFDQHAAERRAREASAMS